ncbi:MAG: hypothetical protein ACRCX2_34605 [Paraclostridium sp.]
MSYFDIEYEIEKRLITGLRSVFENDEYFVYNDNEDEEGLKITTDFPESDEFPFNNPHLVVANVNYQDNLHNSFAYNFMQDVNYKGMVNGLQKYFKIIPYTVTLICIGSRNNSKDLASRTHHYISHIASYHFNEVLGLQIQEISKSATSPSKQYPNKVFETQVNIRGTLYWTGDKKPDKKNVLDYIDSPLQNINIKF